MENISKKVVSDNRNVKYDISSLSFIPLHTITDTDATDTFDKRHPLYIPLIHLLNGDDELIIDDDDTHELNENYMRIYRDNENINIDFIYCGEDELAFNKFTVFVKNIGYDLRSKIDCQKKDTKDRLHYFFGEVYEKFMEEDSDE